MPEFSQLQQTQPVIREQQVASKAKGSQAMAQAFGQVAQMAMKTSFSLAKQHSQAMFMHAMTQASDIQTQSQIDILKNPGQADSIQKNTEAALKKASQSPMNSTDRQRFKYFMGQKQNAIKLQAARTDAKQAQLAHVIDYSTSFKQMSSDYQHALVTGDEKGADYLHQNMSENARNAVMSGTISPQAYQNSLKTVDMVHQRMDDFYKLMGDKDATAAKLHAAALNPLSDHNLNVGDLPANAGTEHLANHYSDHMTSQDISTSITNMKINPHVIQSMLNQKEDGWNKSMEQMRGSLSAHGLINSNPAHHEIEIRQEELNSKGDLTSAETAQLHVLNDYEKRLGTNFDSTIASTSAGARLVQEWQEQKSAKENIVDPAAKAAALQIEDKNFVDEKIALAEGSHMPNKYINPIDAGTVSQAKTSFAPDGDPQTMIDKMSYLGSNQRSYLAKQMKDPVQSEVGYGMAYGMDKGMTESFQRQLIASQQKGRDYSKLSYHEQGEDKVSSAVLGQKISSEMNDILSNISSLPDGQERGQAFVGSAINFIKFKASSNADYTLSHVDDYISEFKNQMSTAYDMQQGSNYSFNKSQHSLTSKEYDMLADSAIDSAYENLRHHDKKMTEDRFQSLIDRMNVSASFASDGSVLVTTDQGNIIYNAPYTGTLLNHAKENARINREKHNKSWQEMFVSSYKGV